MPDPVVPTPAPAPVPEPVAPADVPEWLDPKFAVRNDAGVFDLTLSAQKQAASYKELHATHTRTTQTPAPTDPTKPTEPAVTDPTKPTEPPATPDDSPIARASTYFAEHGKLGDEHYAELAKANISREMVDQYIAGHVATQASYNDALYTAAGGQAQYDAAIAWAAANLPAAEAEAFDAVIETGNAEQAKLAVQGLMSRHVAAVGRTPNYVDGGGNSGTGAVGFRSQAEVRTAMGDPRYRVDAAYREDVARRLAATPDNIS